MKIIYKLMIYHQLPGADKCKEFIRIYYTLKNHTKHIDNCTLVVDFTKEICLILIHIVVARLGIFAKLNKF